MGMRYDQDKIYNLYEKHGASTANCTTGVEVGISSLSVHLF